MYDSKQFPSKIILSKIISIKIHNYNLTIVLTVIICMLLNFNIMYGLIYQTCIKYCKTVNTEYFCTRLAH